MSVAAKRFGLSEAQVFGARFFALLIGASALSWAVNLPARLGGPQRWIAGAATRLARGIGSTSSVTFDKIHVQNLIIDINYECTGIYVLLILFSFLFAYPASWRARTGGALIGTAGLTFINILRIGVLVRIAELAPDLFGYFHEYIWQGLFLVLVIAYAMTWVERVR